MAGLFHVPNPSLALAAIVSSGLLEENQQCTADFLHTPSQSLALITIGFVFGILLFLVRQHWSVSSNLPVEEYERGLRYIQQTDKEQGYFCAERFF